MHGDAVLSESCVRILKPCREVRSMTSRPPTNVPASVHQRLLNLARQTNRSFNVFYSISPSSSPCSFQELLNGLSKVRDLAQQGLSFASTQC